MIARDNPENKILKKLLISYKAFFESKLALLIHEHIHVFQVLPKLSAIMISLLHNNRIRLLEEVLSAEKIKNDLYGENCFGRIRELNSQQLQSIAAEDIYADILNALTDKTVTLDKLMQVHSVFIYRIMPAITKEKLANAPVNSHARIEKEGAIAASQELGIMKSHYFFRNAFVNSTYLHVRAVDKFKSDKTSSYHQLNQDKLLPFVAGPSGHTHTFLRGATFLGVDAEEEKLEYLAAIFAFLACGGNHSFHEVMLVGEQFGLTYQCNDYANSLPNSFKQTAAYLTLQRDFPDLLKNKIECAATKLAEFS